MYNLFDIIFVSVVLFLIMVFMCGFLLWKKFKKPAKLNGMFSSFDNIFFQQFIEVNKYVYDCFFSKQIDKKYKVYFYIFWSLGILSEVVFVITGWCLGSQFSLFTFTLGLVLLYLYILMVANDKFFVTRRYGVRLISIFLVLMLFLRALVTFVYGFLIGMHSYLQIVSFIANIGNMVFYSALLYNGFGTKPSKVEKIIVYSGALLTTVIQCLGLFGCFTKTLGFIDFFSFLYSIASVVYLLFFFDKISFAKDFYNNKLLVFYDNIIVKKIFKKEPKIRTGSKLKEYDVEVKIEK